MHSDRCFNVKFYICELVDGNLELTAKDIIAADFMEADKEVLDKLKKCS